MNTNPRPKLIEVLAIVGGMAVVIAGGVYSGLTNIAHIQEQEAHAAAYVAYVDHATAEADIHQRVNVGLGQAIYQRSADAHAAAVADAEKALAEAKGKVDAPALAEQLPGLSLVGDVRYMDASAQTLTDLSAAVRAKVKAYDAEQARLKAEREAAERAAAEEAAQQAAENSWTPEDSSSGGGGSGGGGSAPAPSGVDYTLYVYASGQDQALVDACGGAVAWWSQGFVEHWSCGGASFPQWAGAVVEIVGYGTYRVTGVIGGLDYNDPSTYWVPSGAFYQTCLGGDSSNTIFIGLERI